MKAHRYRVFVILRWVAVLSAIFALALPLGDNITKYYGTYVMVTWN